VFVASTKSSQIPFDLELVFSKVGDGTGDNEDDNDEDGKGEVFSLSVSDVSGDGSSWIAGDIIEGISSNDVAAEQMEETLPVPSRESSFMEKGEDDDVDGV
jgi:hypothetical protein